MDSSDRQATNSEVEEGDRFYFQSRYFDAITAYQAILGQLSSSPEIFSPELVSLYYKLGLSSFKASRFSDAHLFLDKAFEVIKALENNVSVIEKARILYTKGDTYIEEAKFPEAEEKCKEALKLIKENYGEEHRELIACYNRLARLSEAREDYEEEKSYLKLALNIGSKLSTELDAEVATSYYRSSNAHWYLGENDKACECIQKSLSMRQQIYGEKHLEVTLCYQTLGRIEHDKNNLSEALEYHNKGLNIAIECVGTTHLDLADFYCNIGRVHEGLKQTDEAIKNYKKALEIEEQILPPDHPNIAYIYADFAAVYKQQGKFEEALEAYNKALKQYTLKNGENHLRTAEFYHNLAEVYVKIREYSLARKSVKKQLAIQVKCFGPKDIRLVDTYNDLAFLYFRTNKYKGILENYLKATKINSLLLKERLAGTAFNFLNMSYMFKNVCDTDSQESLAKKSLVSYEKLKGRNHANTRQYATALELSQRRKCLGDCNKNFTF